MKVSRLNERGIATLEGWIESVKVGGSHQAPMTILNDRATTEELGVNVEVEPRQFDTRLEAAEYLYTRFSAAGLTEIDRDRGLWAWLSFYFFDSVCPPGKG